MIQQIWYNKTCTIIVLNNNIYTKRKFFIVAYTYMKKFSLLLLLYSIQSKMSEIMELSDVEELDINYIESDPVSIIGKDKLVDLTN